MTGVPDCHVLLDLSSIGPDGGQIMSWPCLPLCRLPLAYCGRLLPCLGLVASTTAVLTDAWASTVAVAALPCLGHRTWLLFRGH